MFCPNCGTTMTKITPFCSVCGYRFPDTVLGTQAAPKPQSSPAPASQHTPAYDNQAAPVYHSQPAPVYESQAAPASRPEAASSKNEPYSGRSYMEAFRIISGILFLAGLINSLFRPLLLEPLYNKLGMGQLTSPSGVVMLIMDVVFFCLAPGILSIILRKPRFVNGLILTILFGLLLLTWVGARLFNIISMIQAKMMNGQQLIYTVLSLPVGLIFCLIMALVSLRSPVFLVGEPHPVSQRGFKIASGILHLVSAALLLVGSAVVICIALLNGTPSATQLATVISMVSLFIIGGSILAAGICSIRAGAGKRASDFSSLYTHVLLVWNGLYLAGTTVFSIIQSSSMSSSSVQKDAAITVIVLSIIFSLILAWYVVCLITAFRSLLQNRRAAEDVRLLQSPGR